MAITVTDALYTTVIDLLRSHLAEGSQLSGAEMLQTLAVVKDAVGRFDGVNTGNTALSDAVDALRTAWDAQIAILQAKGTNDASAEIDTAQTVLEPLVVAVEDARDDNDDADPSGPEYVVNPTADGGA